MLMPMILPLRPIVAGALLFAASCFSVWADTTDLSADSSSSQSVPNNGDDITRPPRSFDFRYQFQDKPKDVDQSALILRVNDPFRVVDGWKIATRFDLPFVGSNASGTGNPTGAYQVGMGDVLLQAAVVNEMSERWAAALGVRSTFPTATQGELGSDYIQLGPLGAVRSMLPEISPGSYTLAAARYQYNVGKGPGTGIIYWSPTLSFALPEDWFFILYPSQDIAVNLQGNGRWFVPIDVSFGKNLSRTQVVSLEISQALIKQYTSYNFKLEARYSIYF